MSLDQLTDGKHAQPVKSLALLQLCLPVGESDVLIASMMHALFGIQPPFGVWDITTRQTLTNRLKNTCGPREF